MRESTINWQNAAEVKAYRQAYYRKRKALKNLEEHPVEVKPTEPSKPRKKTTVSVTTPNRGSNDHFKSPYEKVSILTAVERVLDGVFDAVVEKGLKRPQVNVVNTTDGIEVKVVYFQNCEITFGVTKKGVTFVWGKRYLSGTDIDILRALDQNCVDILKGTARVIYDGPFTKYSDDPDIYVDDF